MRVSIVVPLLAAVLLPRAAAAEPCQVTYARAPEDVRKVIESWVRAEPRCVTTLELRVIPTDGGLYLMARDGNGRVHERLVPDAQSAGVLVASWIADDSSPPAAGPQLPADAPAIDPNAPAAEPPSNAPGTTAPAATASVAPEARPGAANTAPAAAPAAVGAPTAVTVTAPAPAGIGHWLTFGILAGGRGGGLRGELDLLTLGRWSIGTALALSTWESDLYSFTSSGFVDATDFRALMTLGRTIPRGRWSLRLGVGAGFVHTSVDGFLGSQNLHASGVFPTAEATAMVSRRIFARWAVTTGAVVTWYAQEYNVMSQDPFTEPDTTAQRAADLMYLFGVRRSM